MNAITSSSGKLNSMRQRGVSMVIVLVFIVILSSLGVYGLRRALLNENTSRNVLDLQVASQAAAAALRDGERDILSVSSFSLGAACGRGVDRPMPPVIGYNFTPPTWDATCPAGQCVVESGKRADAYFRSKFPNSKIQPWWPASTANGQPPIWNNDNSTKPSSTNPSNCNTFTGGVPYGTYTGAPAVPGVWRQPEYLIEAVRSGFIIYYRISARGWGLNPNSEVLMQSIVNLQVK
jgi:type IV pilus assembly protein PilX